MQQLIAEFLFCQLKPILPSICQDMAKKDEGNPQKSDDETEKKAGSGAEDDEVEEEVYDEEDIEEVGLC